MHNFNLGDSPAFPRMGQIQYGDTTESVNWEGMNLRTYIATKCLAGLLSDKQNLIEMGRKGGEQPHEYLAKLSVAFADDLLSELEKPQNSPK